MLCYYGIELLQQLQDYYRHRLQMAQSRGFMEQGHKFYWLYEELLLRTQLLRQTMLYLDALPKFMNENDTDAAFQYVISYGSDWFRKNAIGESPQTTDGKSELYSDSDPYWSDVVEAMDNFGTDYNVKVLPLLYIDLCEYVVRCVRFLFHVREHYAHAIDKEKFDELMKRDNALPSTA